MFPSCSVPTGSNYRGLGDYLMFLGSNLDQLCSRKILYTLYYLSSLTPDIFKREAFFWWELNFLIIFDCITLIYLILK